MMNSFENIDNKIHKEVESKMHVSSNIIKEETANAIVNGTKKIMGTLVEYKELMMMYACAMKEVKTKFDVLNTEFKVRYERNPISYITTRLKKTYSITEKLARKAKEFSLANIEEYIHDIAGVRVVCAYIDDIYMISEALLNQDDITLIEKKDYIASPKSNGYRSLHLIVKVPVFFAEQRKELKVEVQLRTIAMDFWASLEHQMKYKHNIPNEKDIVEQLSLCAEIISKTDERMLDIRKRIEDAEDKPTKDEILFDKISKLDIDVE